MDYQSLSDEDLVKECAKGPGSPAWDEFSHRYNKLIASVVTKVCWEWSERSQETVKDRINDVYVKLLDNCAILSRFSPRHDNAFQGFLSALTANLVCDYFRACHAQKRNVANTVELVEEMHESQEGCDDPNGIEMRLFFKEIDELLQKPESGIRKHERTIFWLYYLQGFTSKEIAALPWNNLTVKGVESVIRRLTVFVKKHVLEPNSKAAKGI